MLLYFSSDKSSYHPIVEGISLIISAPYYKGMNDMITSSSGGTGEGMLWNRKHPTDTKSDIHHSAGLGWYTLADVYTYMCYCFVLYAGLTWYLDHVVPNAYGLALGPFFFLDPAYWGFRRTSQAVEEESTDDLGPSPDDDVKAEAAAVRAGERDHCAVIIKGVKKTVYLS